MYQQKWSLWLDLVYFYTMVGVLISGVLFVTQEHHLITDGLSQGIHWVSNGIGIS